MDGTLVCAVTDGPESDDAVGLAVSVSDRLRLRLVLAHVVDGIADVGNGSGDGDESVTMKADRQTAERRVAELARTHGAETAERRVGVGEPAELLAQIATEEAADVIVVGARTRGWRRRLETTLAEELERETPIPVVIAPPQRRHVPRGAATEVRR
jgi:nucleotide-binding universal stress UspA family protein